MKKTKILFLIFIFFISLSKSMNLEADPDFWWHLKDGEYVFANHEVPKENIYTFISPRNWVAHSFLFDTSLFLFYKYLGTSGIFFFKLFILSFLFSLIIYRVAKYNQSILSFLILYISSYTLLSWGFTLRPHLFTYIFIFLTLIVLEKRLFIFIPLILLIWSYLHAGVTAGVGIILIYVFTQFLKKSFKESFKIFLYLSSGIFLILILNPYHFKYFMWVYNVFKSNIKIWSKYITEWEPIIYPVLIDHEIYYLFCLIIMLFLLFVFTFSNQKKNLFHVLLLLSIFYGALRYVRNIPLFGIISAFILPFYFENFFKFKITFNKLGKIRFNFLLNIFFILGSAYYLSDMFLNNRKIEIDPKFYPVSAVEFIKENKIKGNILSPSDRGGFIEYHLFPDCKIFADGRLSLSPEALRDFFQFWNLEISPFYFLEKYPVEIIIMPKNIMLYFIIKKRKKWVKIYEDKYFSVFHLRFPKFKS